MKLKNTLDNTQDLRGVFFIMRGKFKKASPTVTDKEGNTFYLGGYNPEDTTNDEWYMLIDKNTMACLSAGSNFNNVLHTLEEYIRRFKTQKNYYRWWCSFVECDYYTKHFGPLVPVEGSSSVRSTGVGYNTFVLRKGVYDLWGNYYSAPIKEAEDRAYEEYHSANSAFKRNKKRLRIRK